MWAVQFPSISLIAPTFASTAAFLPPAGPDTPLCASVPTGDPPDPTMAVFRLELIPSASKRTAWELFCGQISGLARQEAPTRHRLQLLHLLCTTDAEAQALAQLREQGEIDLMILDRPDAEAKAALFAESRAAIAQAQGTKSPCLALLLTQARQAYRDICAGDTELRFEVRLRGELRAYGQRRIGNGAWETVYAAHTCVFGNEIEEGFVAMAGSLPTAYYGLSTGLPEVYVALCDRYDSLMAAARGFDQKLLAEIFLQLVGTRLLHPFWDGNGRTFAAHLVITLERMGIVIRDWRHVEALTRLLTPINDNFLRCVLERADLSFIRGNDHLAITLFPQWRTEYMRRLREAMEAVIAEGPDGTGAQCRFFAEAAFAIKTYLVREGLLELSSGERRRLREVIDDKAGAIQQVPAELQREYLLERHAAFYLENSQRAALFNHTIGDLWQAGHREAAFAFLVRLMQAYQGLRLDYRMALEYEAALIPGGLPETSDVIAALLDPAILAAVSSWPEETRDILARELWEVVRGEFTLPQTLLLIPPVLASDEVRNLYARYQMDGNLNFRIVEMAVAVTGHTRDDTLAVRAARCLMQGPLEPGPPSTLCELAQYTQDQQAVDDCITIMEILVERQEPQLLHEFFQAVSAELYRARRAEDYGPLKEGLRSLHLEA